MANIGVRELKTHASEIIRRVKEKRMRYIVTYRGHPVAAIVPIEDALPGDAREISSWDELVLLGQQIGEGWKSKQTSEEILAEMRR